VNKISAVTALKPMMYTLPLAKEYKVGLGTLPYI